MKSVLSFVRSWRLFKMVVIAFAITLVCQAAEARGLAPRACVRARVAQHRDARAVNRVQRRGLALRSAVVFRNGLPFHRFNAVRLAFVAPHFNRANFVQLVPTTVGYSRVQLIAADQCDVPTVDDNPPLAAAFQRRLLVTDY